MGFRFFNLNPIRRACFASGISSRPRKHSNLYLPSRFLSIGALSHLQYDHPVTFSEHPNFKISTRWHVGHSHKPHQIHDHSAEGEKIFQMGLAADIGLAVGKALTGYLSGSSAIIADAAHSVSDAVLSGVALLSFKAARIPKDKEHPYGHGKFETLGALGISCMLFTTAGGIAWHAFDILAGLLSGVTELASHSVVHEQGHNSYYDQNQHGIKMNHPILALNMTIASITIKEGLYWITKRAGERAGSGLMKANAWHHRADAVSSVVALIGVGGSILGVKILDPLAGLVVSGMILKAGLETGYQSVLELVDAAVPSQELDAFKQTILQVEGVKGFNHMRGRRAGSTLYLDVNIEVDPLLTVVAAHEVVENVRSQIQKIHPEVAEVFINIEPSISHRPPSATGLEVDPNSPTSTSTTECKDIVNLVSSLLSSKLTEKTIVEHIKHQSLQGKSYLLIKVLMSNDSLSGDAKKMAAEAEKHVFKSDCNINQDEISSDKPS